MWEARRIIRGYRKRGRLEQQLLRLTAYMSCYAFRGSDGKTPEAFCPLPWEKDEELIESPLSDEEAAAIRAEMAAINAQFQE